VLGYSNVRQSEGGPSLRVVNEAEATIVRRIFTLATEGKGLLRIAKALNVEGIKNPTGQDRAKAGKRSDQWSSTGIREVLHRDLYRGRVVYGKTTWAYHKGRKFKVAAPESEWIILDRPELRIISDELWQATHTRMKATHAVYLRRNDGRLNGRPASGLESKHLLSGYLRCGVCGGNLVYSKKWGQRGRPVGIYACATRRTRPGACSNKYGVPAVALTEAVLDQLRYYLDLAVITRRITSALQAPMAHEQERQAVVAQVADLDRELARLADAVAAGGQIPALVARMKETQHRRDEAGAPGWADHW
jgi:hypothetical protein